MNPDSSPTVSGSCSSSSSSKIQQHQQIKSSMPDIISMANSISQHGDPNSVNQSIIDSFLDLIEKHWICLVPEIYQPKSGRLNPTFDEKRAFEELLAPLEWFITANEQPRDLLDKLKNISKPPQLCGRVFKPGEPNYNCRECSLDGTCVLCVDCFKNSVHRNHRYRICLSSSGYCDCGDPEAWKCNPTCSTHETNAANMESSDSVLTGIMKQTEFSHMLARLRVVFRYVLDYIYVMLKWNQTHLPARLQRKYPNQCQWFVSVLYNDETHTYEHVIMALNKSIDCNNELATDYATAVDREGRCVIFRDNEERCKTVATMIAETSRKNSDKILEVKVLSTDLVAHQTFATRLMNWITELLPICSQFRQAFAEHLLGQNHRFWRFDFDESADNQASHQLTSDMSLLEKIMLSDTWFWKSIRVLWHQLFMSGLLLDIEPKKQFARLFTRNYHSLLRDYIQDDHEHRVSILSLAVQIYTVPSIAAMLIEEENGLAIILNSFLELNHTYHQGGRFKFDSSTITFPFKRSFAAMCDLQYLLIKANDSVQWTDQMRVNFVHGAEAFIKLLKRIQNMDSIIRQVVQHIEYEPGWDTGMNFETKIGPIIKAFLDWIITDRKVYIDVLNIGLAIQKDSFEYYANGGNGQNQNPLTNSQCTTVRRHYADKSAMVWDYNVGRKEVSVHIPLSRFIASLLLHLPKFNLLNDYLNYYQHSVLTLNRLNPESMMELALRIQVLLGQFRAGMWRRNGYSLINQIMLYQGARLRETTYDLDIITLQLAAAMLDPNEFMIHLMYKYNVDRMLDERDQTFAKRNDDLTRHQITLLEEFLRLIYTLLMERYVVGLGAVTTQDCLQNEIIQWLCKQSMSHSDLMAHLSADENEKMIEDIVLQVAEFKPSNSRSNTAGKYVLKEAYHERFNPFFYHYSRQDQSAAYESQLRRKSERKEKFYCCPPPPLPDFIEPFQSINQILLCDVTMTIIKAVLSKTINLKVFYFSDFQFQQCLYLIGIALNEESKHPDSFKFSQKATDFGIVSLLEQCSSKHILSRVQMHYGLYEWCLDRFKQVFQMQSNNCNVNNAMDNDGSGSIVRADTEICSGLQDQEQERNRRKMIAAARKEKILSQMKQMQRSFLKENEQYFKENLIDDNRMSMSNVSKEQQSDTESEESVALGRYRTAPLYSRNPTASDDFFTCILCLESQDVNHNNGRYLLMSAYIQRSTVLSKNRSIQSWMGNMNNLFARSDHNFGPFVNTCTHYMHNDCFDKYIETSAANERRRSAHRYPRLTFDLREREFLCPLCECLCNLTIPMMPSLHRPVYASTLQTDLSIDQWLNAMLNMLQDCNTIWIDNMDNLVKVNGFSKNFHQCTQSLPEDLRLKFNDLRTEYQLNRQPCLDGDETSRQTRDNIVDLFCETIHKKTMVDGNSADAVKNDAHQSIQCIYWSIAFTIQVLEGLMRLDDNSFSQLVDTRLYQCLRGLVSFVRTQLNFFSNIYPRRMFLYLMNYLLVNTVYQSSPYHLLDVDAFTILITLMATGPSFFEDQSSNPGSETNPVPPLLANKSGNQSKRDSFIVPLGNAFDKNLIELMLIFHMVQIILTNTNLDENDAEPMDIDDGQADALVDETDESQSMMVASFCQDILIAAGHKFSTEKLMSKASRLSAKIKHNSLPFIRSVAIYVCFQTDIRWPKKLWEKSKKVKLSSIEEYDILCRYLAIESNLASLMQNADLRHLCLSWTRHQKLSTLFNVDNCGETHTVLKPSYQHMKQPHTINRLVPLPHDFSDLINSVANFTCPNSNGEESRSPTMCLICGEILCSQNYCCQRRVGGHPVGACTYHSQQCSASVGIFLRIRDNKVLLLMSRGRGCYMPSPYVDKYGETDSGLFRGGPMFLSNAAYERLYRMWFGHSIPEQIVHQMETSNSLANFNWNIM